MVSRVLSLKKVFFRSYSSSGSNINTEPILITGAGISGISTAYHLAKKMLGERSNSKPNIVVIDNRPILSFTSAMSTEAYRNFWPDVAMTKFMDRSIDIIMDLARKSNNGFSLSQNGYLFVSASKDRHEARAYQAEKCGSGKVTKIDQNNLKNFKPKINPITENISGIDLISSQSAIQSIFPYLSPQASSALFPRRCGWMNAQQFGSFMAQKAREYGVTFLRGKITRITQDSSKLKSVIVETEGGTKEEIFISDFINCAGPFVKSIHNLIRDIPELPVYNEIHGKVVMKDTLRIVPENAPMLIWDDPITLDWTEAEIKELQNMGGIYSQIVGEIPGGVHMRPYPGGFLLMLWDFVHSGREVPDPPPEQIFFEEIYPELVIKGLSVMVPRMKEYLQDLPKVTVDGGYYAKSPDHRPIIGKTQISNYYICSAFAGYGIMASPAGGELLSQHFFNEELPFYAKDLDPKRFEDPNYVSIQNQTGRDL